MIEKMTIDDLALMIRNTMATKEDVQRIEERMATDVQHIATNLQIFHEETNTRLDHLDARVGRIEADIHELQEGVVYRHELEDVLGRIKYIERKLGIESGV